MLLLGTVFGVSLIAKRVGLSQPILLFLAGCIMSVLPFCPHIKLDPEVIFDIFLPPMVYAGGWYISWQDLKLNLRIIFFLAIGLVIATTMVVAWVTHFYQPQIPLGVALVLGAIISPPDAVAAASLIKKFRIHNRVIHVLEEEGVLNDAVALVIYNYAIAAVVNSQFSLPAFSQSFFIAAIGGVLFGLLLGKIFGWIWNRIDDFALEVVYSLIIPYVTYFTAQQLGFSGVLSVVVCGIYLGQRSHQMLSTNTRIYAKGFWQSFLFALEGMVFLLTGFQLPAMISALQSYPAEQLVGLAVLVNATVILLRMVWLYTFAYVPRFLFPAIRKKDPYPDWRNVFIISWSGMRGVISIAAALAIPLYTAKFSPFPFRELVIFLTFSVIITTLVFQGLTLSKIIRWFNLENETCNECDLIHAQIQSVDGALKKIETLIATEENDLQRDALERLQAKYHHRYRLLSSPNASLLPMNKKNGTMTLFEANKHDHAEKPLEKLGLQVVEFAHELEKSLLNEERSILYALRDTGAISEETKNKLQYQIDLEELHLLERSHLELIAVNSN